ncbi:MAG: hypothetical protein K2M04_04105 [Muribaculaceae bacterium]|nr:hypothetical protein [Muribaculaceae bacterium]
MDRYLKERERQKMAYDKLSKEPTNLRLKRGAVVSAILAVSLLLLPILCGDHISWRSMLIMRGSAGVCALVFAILYAVMMYRMNAQYIRQRHNIKKEEETES